MELLTTIVITLFTLGVLITFHEYGHFWVARKCGIKVLRFSIGFGTPLLRWRDKRDTEYVLAALPLGGYVKMLDEREGEVPAEELDQAFNRKSVWARIAVVIAGPVANLLLAVVVLACVFLSGERGFVPIVGSVVPDSLAAQAGLEAGQEIIAIDDAETPTWQALNLQLLKRLGETGSMTVSASYPGSDLVYNSEVQLQDWLRGEEQPDLMAGFGLKLFTPKIEMLISRVVVDSPAERAGLQVGDFIEAADSIEMADWNQWVEYVRSRPETDIQLRFRRDGETINTVIRPAAEIAEDGEKFGLVGVAASLGRWPEGSIREYNYSVLEAVSAGAKRTGELSIFTLQSIKKMLVGQISAKNLSGPITIAKVASDSAQAGWRSYLNFLALLSVSLGVLNLLPIPVLDGGHLLYYIVEVFKGSAVSERVQLVGQQLGLFVILGVMLLALFNDFSRL